MDITVPDSVSFYTEEYRNGMWKWGNYCFAHAVLRALESEQIKTKLVESYLSPPCDDCTNFGDPQSHELSSLRREQ
jgi:hypothetical protein